MDERFAQTAAGWVLRELSVAETGPVTSFLEEHGGRMSGEALRSSRKRLSAV